MEIITSHTNTDMDALASMVAAQKIYPGAVMVFPGPLLKNVEEFMALHKDTLNVRTVKDIDRDFGQKDHSGRYENSRTPGQAGGFIGKDRH